MLVLYRNGSTVQAGFGLETARGKSCIVLLDCLVLPSGTSSQTQPLNWVLLSQVWWHWAPARVYNTLIVTWSDSWASLYYYTHTHPFNGPFSGTTRVSRYQKGKPIWVFLWSKRQWSSGISWAICKSASRSRLITMPAPNHSVFYRPNALPTTQPTASKHWRPLYDFLTYVIRLHHDA